MRQHADMARKAACVQFNLSPLGFHGWADRYFQDYRDLAQSSQDAPAPYLLLCRVIELELRAWHRQTRKVTVLTNKFGHDLVASYRALPAKHRVLSSDEVGLLARANETYARQGFEHIGAPRAEWGPETRLDRAALEAVAEKMMEHGDRLNLAQG